MGMIMEINKNVLYATANQVPTIREYLIYLNGRITQLEDVVKNISNTLNKIEHNNDFT